MSQSGELMYYCHPDEDTFQMAFCTTLGRVMMEELRLLICLDATHKTNMYNFQLFSFVAQNSYGQAVPIAFLITSDAQTFRDWGSVTNFSLAL